MNKKKGFTLVEVLAVVIVLGIISIIIYPVLNSILEDNRKKAFEQSLKGVVRAAEMYKANNNNFVVIDYDDNDLNLANDQAYQSGAISFEKDEETGEISVYLSNFYNGEFCGSGFSNNLKITKGKCSEAQHDYCFKSEGNKITGYNYQISSCPKKHIVIPETIEGVAIEIIGNEAFSYSAFSSVKFSENIKIIESSAFYNSNITSIDFSKAINLREIGNYAFSYLGLHELDLSSLVSLEVIGDAAFYHSNIYGELDFSKLVNLKRIGEDVSNYNDGAFESNSITKVKLSNLPKLEFIGSNAFGSNMISEINFDNSGIETIESYAFSSNELTNVDFSSLESLNNIGSYAFSSNDLTNVNFGNSTLLNTIKEYAFAYNEISNIDFKKLKGLKIMLDYAFLENNISNFSTSYLPNIKYVGEGILNKNKLPENQAYIYYVGDYGEYYDTFFVDGIRYDTNWIISYGGTNNKPILPNNTVGIGKNAFSQHTALEYDMSDSINLKYIDSNAFYKNQSLEKLILNEGLLKIGKSAFLDSNLTNIVIPESVVAIGNVSFSGTSWSSVIVNYNATNLKSRFNGVWTDIGWPMSLIQKDDIQYVSLSTTEANNFDYLSFNYYEVVVPTTGKYKLEVWGAQGGATGSRVGKGGYSTGEVYLNTGDKLYIHIGGQGTSGNNSINHDFVGGYNGGGGGAARSYTGSSGGGATDIRINTNSLYARVIVAGGGGGYGSVSYDTPGSGGGVEGIGTYNNSSFYTTGGTQISGGVSGCNKSKATFGAGIIGDGMCGHIYGYPYTGGGGGWYGGGGSNVSAAGGSGWIYTADAYNIWQTGNPTDAAKWLLNSSYYLTNASTIAGNSSMPSITVGSNETGHSGNGYARITFIS